MSELVSPIDASILQIAIDENLAIDIHQTSQEHAVKELSNWHEFVDSLERTDRSLPEVDDDPFFYYLADGPGYFSRAHLTKHPYLILGALAASPTENQGFRVDAVQSIDDAHLAATGLQRMLTHNIFNELRVMRGARYLDFPPDEVAQNPGLQRALYDFAIPIADAYRIQLAFGAACRADLQKPEDLQTALCTLPMNYTGVVSTTFIEDPSVLHEVVMQNGQHLGAVIVKATGDEGIRDITAQTADSESPLEPTLPFALLRDSSAIRLAHFMKLASEADTRVVDVVKAL